MLPKTSPNSPISFRAAFHPFENPGLGVQKKLLVPREFGVPLAQSILRNWAKIHPQTLQKLVSKRETGQEKKPQFLRGGAINPFYNPPRGFMGKGFLKIFTPFFFPPEKHQNITGGNSGNQNLRGFGKDEGPDGLGVLAVLGPPPVIHPPGYPRVVGRGAWPLGGPFFPKCGLR